MLDRLLIRHNTHRDVFTPDYKPNQAITKSLLANETGANLNVLFPPWHGGGRAYERLINRIVKSGDAVLAYYFHDEILKPSCGSVAASFNVIRDTVAKDLGSIADTHDYRRVKLIAMSLGNPALAVVTSEFTDFDSATLVVGASSLATSMWHGTRTRHIRTGIEQEGHDLSSLERAWSDLAPANHVGALIGKDVTLLVSTTDEIIPAKHQEELVYAVQAAGIAPDIQRTRLGHYAAIGRFCLYGNP